MRKVLQVPKKCFHTSCQLRGSSLYPNHVPTSLVQKLLLAGGSAAVALSDPWRADMVAVNGEVTGLPALKYMHSQVWSCNISKHETIAVLLDGE